MADGGCQLARIPALARARTRPSPGAVPRRARAENSRRALALKARAAPRFTRERARLATGETRGLLYDNGQGDNGVSDVPGLPTCRPQAFPGGRLHRHRRLTQTLLALPEGVRRRPPRASGYRAAHDSTTEFVSRSLSLSLFLFPLLSALRTQGVCMSACVCMCVRVAPHLLAGILVARVHALCTASHRRLASGDAEDDESAPTPPSPRRDAAPHPSYSVSPSLLRPFDLIAGPIDTDAARIRVILSLSARNCGSFAPFPSSSRRRRRVGSI